MATSGAAPTDDTGSTDGARPTDGAVPSDRPATCDAVIVGAGIAGLYQLHRLRELGLYVRLSRRATGSAAPGTGTATRARAATSRACRTPTRSPRSSSRSGRGREKYPTQPEILRYVNHVADRFDLRRDITFDTRVTAAAYDETARGGASTTDDRRAIVSAQFLIMATGCLSASKDPEVPGIDTFTRRVLPHRALAARGRRLHRPAARRDRHRLVGHPVDPAHRRAGRGPDRVPAHAELLACRRGNRPLTPRTRSRR